MFANYAFCKDSELLSGNLHIIFENNLLLMKYVSQRIW